MPRDLTRSRSDRSLTLAAEQVVLCEFERAQTALLALAGRDVWLAGALAGAGVADADPANRAGRVTVAV